MKKAIVLLSGGLDSTTTLYIARSEGYKVFGLIFDYGQRHKKEILKAKKIARLVCEDFKVVRIALPWKGSALLDKKISVPQRATIDLKKIPSTYVPARNIIFLSFAASYAEAIGAQAIFIGANARDYSGYPDCRPEFFKAFQRVLKVGMKAGVEGRVLQVVAPLLYQTKAQIIQSGLKLKVPYDLTWSCYVGGKNPCGRCDSCVLRQKGFSELNKKDPILK